MVFEISCEPRFVKMLLDPSYNVTVILVSLLFAFLIFTLHFYDLSSLNLQEAHKFSD